MIKYMRNVQETWQDRRRKQYLKIIIKNNKIQD